MPEWTFRIEGDPKPWQAQMRQAARSVGFLCMEAWKETIGIALRHEKPRAGPVALDIEFYRELPETAPQHRLNAIKRYQDSHIIKRPDASNMRKAFEDACQGFLYHDDSQIVDGYTKKRFAKSGESGYTIARLRTVEL